MGHHHHHRFDIYRAAGKTNNANVMTRYCGMISPRPMYPAPRAIPREHPPPRRAVSSSLAGRCPSLSRSRARACSCSSSPPLPSHHYSSARPPSTLRRRRRRHGRVGTPTTYPRTNRHPSLRTFRVSPPRCTRRHRHTLCSSHPCIPNYRRRLRRCVPFGRECGRVCRPHRCIVRVCERTTSRSSIRGGGRRGRR